MWPALLLRLSGRAEALDEPIQDQRVSPFQRWGRKRHFPILSGNFNFRKIFAFAFTGAQYGWPFPRVESFNARIPAMSKLRAKKIKLLLFDVDGVLTDGKLFIFPAPAGAQQTTQEHSAKHGGQR